MLHRIYLPHLHPVFFYVCAYMIGIIYCFLQFNYLFSLSLIAIILFLLFERIIEYKQLFFLIFFTFLGGYRFYNQQTDYYKFQIMANQSMIVTLTDINQLAQARNQYKINATIDYCLNNPQIVGRQIILYSKNELGYHVGDVIYIPNFLLKNTNKESLRKYLIKEEIIGNFFIKEAHFTLLYRPYISFIRYIHDLRERLIINFKNKMSHQTFCYFSCLFLGNKKVSKLFNKLKEYCKNWGILHYLARSGLHLVLFACCIEIILGFIPLFFLIKNLIAIFLLGIYFFLTWNSTSFMRSVLMLLCYKLCACFMRQIHVTHILSLVTFWTLWFNPILLFFLDFQLSFGITFVIALFNLIHQQTRQLAA